MVKLHKPVFPEEEFGQRRERVRQDMRQKGMDALLVSSPENIYYLCGLDHMGYFACQFLLLPLDGRSALVTRTMEKATIRDQVPHLRHIGYADGSTLTREGVGSAAPLLDLSDPLEDTGVAGEMPWRGSVGSVGMPVRAGATASDRSPAVVRAVCTAIKEYGLAKGRIGLEKSSTFLPYGIAERVVQELSDTRFVDASGLVDQCRFLQSPRELACTKEAASLSDSMMLAAVAAAGPGIYLRDVMAAIYDAMFRRGGTYPGFVPLVRTQRTLEHEHGTWQDIRLARNDVLFLEMAGCIRRYHAPMGRLVFIGRPPKSAYKINDVCRQAMEKAIERIGPGVSAGDVYRAWQAVLDKADLSHYLRHHCGYSVGIGFPPSWSGSGVPVGLRADADMTLRPGMVFHVLSWLLRTGKGDAFISDSVVVTEDGCDLLTRVSHDVIVRD